MTSLLIRQLTPQSTFTNEQVDVRNQLNAVLQKGGLQQPLAPQLLMAVFLYSPPGLMEVANPQQNMPAWLAQAYEELYRQPSSPYVIRSEPMRSSRVCRGVITIIVTPRGGGR